MSSNQTISTLGITVACDLVSSRITVSREFEATPHVIWEAWTEARRLEKWWAPKPFKAVTKDFDFRVGGHWNYLMAGPNDETHWAAMHFTRIDTLHSFESTSYLTDDTGMVRSDLPVTFWHVQFTKSAVGTLLDVTVTGAEPRALEKLLEMGFEDGFRQSLENLDNLLE
jgi:uncharacterized protein YndB with AHSA1/START domain